MGSDAKKKTRSEVPVLCRRARSVTSPWAEAGRTSWSLPCMILHGKARVWTRLGKDKRRKSRRKRLRRLIFWLLTSLIFKTKTLVLYSSTRCRQSLSQRSARKISVSALPTVQKLSRGASKKNRISSVNGELKCSGVGTTSRRTKENSSGTKARQCFVRRSWSSVLLVMRCRRSRNSRNWNGCCRTVTDLLPCGRRKQSCRQTTSLVGVEGATYALFLTLYLLGANLLDAVQVSHVTLFSELCLCC